MFGVPQSFLPFLVQVGKLLPSEKPIVFTKIVNRDQVVMNALYPLVIYTTKDIYFPKNTNYGLQYLKKILQFTNIFM